MNTCLPIRVDYQLIQDVWSAVTVEPHSWQFDGENINLRALVPGLTNRLGKRKYVFVAQDLLPAEQRPQFDAGRLRSLRRDFRVPLIDGEREEIKLLECLPADPTHIGIELDPLKLRDDFLLLEENTSKLLAFLNQYGAWDYNYSFGRWFGRSLDYPKDSRMPGPYLVPPGAFWCYRERLRSRIEDAVLDASQWFQSRPAAISLEQLSIFPFHAVRVSYAAEAIETSFTLDFLKNVPMALCAREDCRRLYFLTRKSKIFCSEKCARCMVTRRSRSQKQLTEAKA